MTRLSSQKILEENGSSQDPASITSLNLNHKALTDVSCLSDFKNLERLDLSFNNLSSLQDLRACGNLKWLSVSQNKLLNLQGIENLTNLNVLNASRNKLKSMEEVKSLVSLRALILNDNQISSMSKLDQLKDLNTIVLSKNPIHVMGDSLAELKSITKLSLSYCQLETIGSSVKHLSNLKELRLAHNEITTLPADLAHNIRLQTLDVGNNSITSFSDLKVLSSLHNLKNLNLNGNPVAEKDEIASKIKKLVPDLQIFNSRPIERKNIDNFKLASDSGIVDKVNDLKEKEVKRKKSSKGEKTSSTPSFSQKEDNPFDKVETHDVERTKAKQTLTRTNMQTKKDALSGSEDFIEVKTDLVKQKRKAPKELKVDSVDDRVTPAKLLEHGGGKLEDVLGKKADQASVQDIKSDGGGIVTSSAKRKKVSKKQVTLKLLSPEIEVGMGGPSTWGD